MIDISTIVKSINKETTIETELTLTSFESRLGRLSYSEKAADITSYLKRGECSSAHHGNSRYRHSDTVQPMLGRSSNKHAF